MLNSINVSHFASTIITEINCFQRLIVHLNVTDGHINVWTCTNERTKSPGVNAKCGTYNLMSTELNKIVHFFTVHVSTAGSLLHLKMETFITDRYG